MGSLKKFAGWLSGDKTTTKGPNENLRSAIVNMKIFNKRLARQISRMSLEEKNARKKAIERRTSGDIPGSKLHMKSSLQFRKWAHSTENFRVRLEGVQFKLEQAKAMNDFTGIAQEIAGVLGQLQTQVQTPEIAEIIKQLDLGFGNMEAMFSETTEQLETMDDAASTGITDDEVEQALAEVDVEMSLDTKTTLPSIPGVMHDGEIDDLEAEIKKLKDQRNP